MAMRVTLKTMLGMTAACGLLAGLLGACSSEEIPPLPPAMHPEPEPDGGDGDITEPEDAGPTIPTCVLNPVAGCECAQEGAQRDCRVFYYTDSQDTDVACAIGYLTCTDGEWSECIGVRVVFVAPDEIPPNTVIEGSAPPLLGAHDAGP
jgi:hypothetical protein